MKKSQLIFNIILNIIYLTFCVIAVIQKKYQFVIIMIIINQVVTDITSQIYKSLLLHLSDLVKMIAERIQR